MRDLLYSDSVAPSGLQVEALRVVCDGSVILDVPRLALQGQGPTVILGPNGAGKSILLRCLHGLVRPHEGRVRQDGQLLSPALRARQAMVFQTPVLLRRSVAGNLDFVLRRRGLRRAERRARIEALLEEGGLVGKARQPARSLSGGEAQRLAILRALATDPAILLLDEPTSALDPAATQAIEAMILGASLRGVRVVLVTHDIGQARRLGRDIVLMKSGRVAEQGSARTFFEAPQTAAARRYLAGALVV